MHRMVSFFFIVPLVILVACGNSEPKITQVEVESIVLQHLTNDRGEYSVFWAIEENCEFGVIQVDDQNGEIIKTWETNC
ncbi:hypothetical protein [Solibacillus daqui]|uniref:hypothetical protein n=1 Tax=Solibacillus daqui TaxID=2912187 RepID=UPI0023651748|nr:hypothetical protein [Solibacillus daqui]